MIFSNKINHVAMIMDGNARWAKSKKISFKEGYIKGLNKIKEVVDLCIENKIKFLTLYALSSENIKRPNISIIYEIIKKNFENVVKDLTLDGKVKIKIIGDKDKIPNNIYNILKNLEKSTENNRSLNLNIAFNYGAINELIFSVRKIIKFVNNKKNISVNEQTIRDNLYLPNVPDPDILIRTGGYSRLSNFFTFSIKLYRIIFYKDSMA